MPTAKFCMTSFIRRLESDGGSRSQAELVLLSREIDADKACALLAQIAIRRDLTPSCELFADGDATDNYYYISSGRLLAYQNLLRATPSGPRTAVRVMSAGDFLIFDHAGLRTAGCCALVHSTVICFERTDFERLAALHPELRRFRDEQCFSQHHWNA
jgi:CRP-like cAMP-binding protein